MYTEAKTECRQVIFSSHFHTLLGFSEKAVAKHPLCGNLRVQRPNITLSTINVALRKLKAKKKKQTLRYYWSMWCVLTELQPRSSLANSSIC